MTDREILDTLHGGYMALWDEYDDLKAFDTYEEFTADVRKRVAEGELDDMLVLFVVLEIGDMIKKAPGDRDVEPQVIINAIGYAQSELTAIQSAFAKYQGESVDE